MVPHSIKKKRSHSQTAQVHSIPVSPLQERLQLLHIQGPANALAIWKRGPKPQESNMAGLHVNRFPCA